MYGNVKRGLIVLAVSGGLFALGTGVAYADDGTSGEDGIGSGTQGILGLDVPVDLGGNAISVFGDSSSSGSSTGGSSGSSGSSGSGATTDGTDSVLGGTQGDAAATVPVTVGGNAISVFGDSSSGGSSFAGASGSGSGDSGSAGTTGENGTASGTQAVGDVDAPVTASGNAISVIGDSSAGQSGTATGSVDGESSDAGGSTTGEDSLAGGTQVLAGSATPVAVGGNAISVIGDSSSSGGSGSTSSSGSGAGDGALTTGEDGVLGGNQVVTGADAPVTLGGNAISVVGDSTAGGSGSGGDTGGEVGGETTTPPGVLTPAAVGGISLLADTGSALAMPGFAFAALLLAAGVAFMARTRLARS